MLIHKWLTVFGRYLILMGRTFSRPERMRMFLKQYVKEMAQLGVNSIGIVLHPDEAEHPKPVDAAMGVGIYHP